MKNWYWRKENIEEKNGNQPNEDFVNVAPNLVSKFQYHEDISFENSINYGRTNLEIKELADD